jgi:cyclic pyranopterin phosphate synthase
MTFPTFSHLDADGQAQMVDVGGKTTTDRVAIAKSRLKMQATTGEAIRRSEVAKGDVLNVARIAGIQAAKQTSLLIPLCHLLPLDQVALRSEWLAPDELEWTAEVRCSGKTGVEMEALVAASVAALTVYDMAKALDRSMHVTHVGLWHKAGGAGGRYARDEKLHSSESRDDD